MKLFAKIVLKNGVILEDSFELDEDTTETEAEESAEVLRDGISEGLRLKVTGGITIGNIVFNIQEVAAVEIKIKSF